MSERSMPRTPDEVLEVVLRQLSNASPAKLGLMALVVVLLLGSRTAWYTVQPEETAAILRFGKVVGTAGPGLHFKFPFGIDTIRLVPTARVLKEEFGFRSSPDGRKAAVPDEEGSSESLMLTGDLNVIDVQWIVQYRIEDPRRYLFAVRESRQTLRDISEAVMRRVVGNRLGSDVLTVGRTSISAEVKEEMQKILSSYDAGIRLVTVELQDVTPPDPVKPAFNEVNEARQDFERMINQAQEQANREVPRARGEANKTLAQAEGYAIERVNQAQGEAARFLSVLEAYQGAPEVTKRRLYLEAMRDVLRGAKSIHVVDSEQRALVPWYSVDGSPVATHPAEGGR